MSIQVDPNTPEGRIIQWLLGRGPTKVKQVRRRFRMQRNSLELILKRMMAAGWIDLAGTGLEAFIHLMRKDFSFVGRNVAQRKRIKHKGGRDTSVRTELDEHDVDMTYQ